MLISKTLNFYKRKDIQKAILETAEDKEVAVRYISGGFGKRPDVLMYENDILEHAKKGVSSFHCSEESWYNPLQIDKNTRGKELDAIRKGWDLVLDIDCAFFEYSKISAYYCIKTLRQHGIKSITCKFSGNKGFHIAVPFEAFPKSIGGQDTRLLFPEAARRIAAYIKHIIKDSVSKAIIRLENNDFGNVVEKTGKRPEEIIRYEKNEFGDTIERLNAEPFLDIDTILISPRHLFRMPYSFHEKSELVSVPIDPDNVLSFTKEQAKPENVTTNISFLTRDAEPNEASTLIVQAFDFEVKIEEQPEESEKVYKEFEEVGESIAEEHFPPCIQKILQGLEDGRKRSLFILTNFLSCVGWSGNQIETRMEEWNKQNFEALREVYIKGQLRYHKQNNKKVPPPNCPHASSGNNYYSDMGACLPDNLCRRIKNPIQYSKIKAKAEEKYSKGKKTKKQKETSSKSDDAVTSNQKDGSNQTASKDSVPSNSSNSKMNIE